VPFHLEEQDVGGWMILKWILDSTEDRDQWRALVKAVINLLVPKNVVKF
jgi:hypothetical protein